MFDFNICALLRPAIYLYLVFYRDGTAQCFINDWPPEAAANIAAAYQRKSHMASIPKPPKPIKPPKTKTVKAAKVKLKSSKVKFAMPKPGKPGP